LGRASAGHRGRGVRRRRRLIEPGVPRRGPVVWLCAPQCLDDVPGVVDGPAAPLHATGRRGGDQRQTRRCQRLGGCRHARFCRCPNRSATRGPVHETGVGAAHRRAARGTLRDDHAAVDGGRHDDLSGVVDGRPRCAGGPDRVLGARRWHPGCSPIPWRRASRVCRSWRRVTPRRRRRCSTTAWRSARWTGSAAG